MGGGNAQGSAEGSADAAHSAYWNGIQSITANGQQVNNFTATSLSGTNYRNSFVPAGFNDTTSVPEPETIALLGLGMLGLVASRRKQAQRKNT